MAKLTMRFADSLWRKASDLQIIADRLRANGLQSAAEEIEAAAQHISTAGDAVSNSFAHGEG